MKNCQVWNDGNLNLNILIASKERSLTDSIKEDFEEYDVHPKAH